MKVAILGGGISGLACGWLLDKDGADVKVFERQNRYGGLARSFRWHGFTCDMAAHRLFTRDARVLEELKTLIPLVKHDRRSRIFIGGKWIRDPVNPVELVLRFFPSPGLSFARDYLFGRSLDGEADLSFDTFTRHKFGRSLNEFFFRPYTEKLFGIPASRVSTEWARQKVRVSGPIDMLRRNTKIYFNYFYYPEEGGYGAFSRRFHADIADKVCLSAPVRRIHVENDRVVAITWQAPGGGEITEGFDAVVSTIPVTELARMLGFRLDLRYRPVTFVYLHIARPLCSRSHWIYFGHGDVVINRMAEFKNFSDRGAPKETTVLCAEITAGHDPAGIVRRTVEDLCRLGLIGKDEVLDTLSMREDCGYPVYDVNFTERIAAARERLSRYENLHLLGRNAEFEHKELDDNYASALALRDRLLGVRIREAGKAP